MTVKYYFVVLFGITTNAYLEDGNRYLVVCSGNGTGCKEVTYQPLSSLLELTDVSTTLNELTRTKRAWSDTKEPICKLHCDCAPDFQSLVDSKSDVNQDGSANPGSTQEKIWIISCINYNCSFY